MKKKLLIPFSLFMSCSLFASGIVTGRVISEGNDSIINYIVKLRTRTVRMKATFSQPNFTLPALKGNVKIIISSKGHKSYSAKVEMLYATDINLGKIVLHRKK